MDQVKTAGRVSASADWDEGRGQVSEGKQTRPFIPANRLHTETAEASLSLQ